MSGAGRRWTRPRSPKRCATGASPAPPSTSSPRSRRPKGHPFYALDNVILSPHVSGFLPSYDERCSELFAENLRRYLDGAPLLNLVDRAKGY